MSSIRVYVSDGHVYSWGNGLYGCLGHGVNVNVEKPMQIQALSHEFVVQVGANGDDINDIFLSDF